MDLQSIIRILIAARLLPTHCLVQVSITCHSMLAVVQESDWKDLLQSHFPVYFLQHEQDYSQVTKYRNEYILAYRAYTLRFMPGGNLQQNKVLCFGPYLDPRSIEEIINYTGSFRMPTSKSFADNNTSCICYNNKTLVLTDEELHVFDSAPDASYLATKPGKQHCLGTVQSGSLVFNYHNSLTCFNLETRKLLWKREVDQPATESVPVVFDQMVFYVTRVNFVCVEAHTGNLIFEIEHPLAQTHTRGPEKLVFDGDYVVYLVDSHLTVVNWKTRQSIYAKDLAKICDEKNQDLRYSNKFAIYDGKMFMLVEQATSSAACSYIMRVDLNYSERNPVVRWQRYIGGAAYERNCGYFSSDPCVYGNKIFVLSVSHNESNEIPVVAALDLASGNSIWVTRLHNDYTSADIWKTVELYVIEGTATAEERKKLSNKPGNYRGSIVRVGLQDEGISKYVEAGLTVETGELLFKQEYNNIYSWDVRIECAVSKQFPILITL